MPLSSWLASTMPDLLSMKISIGASHWSNNSFIKLLIYIAWHTHVILLCIPLHNLIVQRLIASSMIKKILLY